MPVFANDPASATKTAALIERSRPNQFDGQYGKLATAAAHAGLHVHEHVINNSAVTDLLDTLEKVNKVQPIDKLRWTLGHVYDISPTNIARAKALGMALGVHGAAMQAAAHMPLRKIADSGIVFRLGTDATIVSHYSPFVTLGWVVSGLDVGGNRVLDETLTREEALIAHTRSNAYLFFQENALGSLEVGKQADLVTRSSTFIRHYDNTFAGRKTVRSGSPASLHGHRARVSLANEGCAKSVNSTSRVAEQIQQDSCRLCGETLGVGAQPFACGKIGNRDAALKC